MRRKRRPSVTPSSRVHTLSVESRDRGEEIVPLSTRMTLPNRSNATITLDSFRLRQHEQLWLRANLQEYGVAGETSAESPR